MDQSFRPSLETAMAQTDIGMPGMSQINHTGQSSLTIVPKLIENTPHLQKRDCPFQ